MDGIFFGGGVSIGKCRDNGILVVTSHYFLSYDAANKCSFSSDPIYWPMNPKTKFRSQKDQEFNTVHVSFPGDI